MAINLVEEIQSKLGYPPLHKVDPNTQEVIEDPQIGPVNYLAQAAIPAVLAGMYKISSSAERSSAVLRGNISSNNVEEIFGENAPEVIEKIAAYANTSEQAVSSELETVIKAATEVVTENVKDRSDEDALKNFFNQQVTNIKKHLPGALQIGKSLRDNTFDDRTHKMEGPMSDAMHAIERLFSDSGNKKEPDSWK